MEPQRAFLIAVAGVRLFDGLCQSVWMTATATTPLVDTLIDGLGAVCVPESRDEEAALLASVPSVTQVERCIRLQEEPLSADAVLRHHAFRSIVLLNTVGRAQAMWMALQGALKQRGRDDVSLILLHSRFFRQDRRAKEQDVASRFRRGAVGSSILVATQVIEAGLDISSECLHTELCPMNALVQRAGRCARYEGESGVVHVYPLPSEPNAWLPYGDPRAEDETLTETRRILHQTIDTRLDPHRTGAWVEAAHGTSDVRALREGWRRRLDTAVRCIEQNAILRDPKRVADLIRGEDTDAVRLVVCSRPPPLLAGGTAWACHGGCWPGRSASAKEAVVGFGTSERMMSRGSRSRGLGTLRERTLSACRRPWPPTTLTLDFALGRLAHARVPGGRSRAVLAIGPCGWRNGQIMPVELPTRHEAAGARAIRCRRGRLPGPALSA